MNFRIKEMALLVAMASCCLATAADLKIPAKYGLLRTRSRWYSDFRKKWRESLE